MQYTYYGHSCFMIQTKGISILFDPFITPNPMAKSIDINTIKCDYIAVSHGHFDHIADLVVIAKQTNAKVIGCFEIGYFLAENGISNFHAMNIGGSFDFEFGRITMVNAIHSNSLEGKYMGASAGFVVDNNEDCFYFAGDTALTYDMKLISHKFKVKSAALPIGGNYTMDYKDALVASDFIECNHIIGLHFDTEPAIKINHQVVKDYYKNAGKKLELMTIGQTINI